MNKYYITKDQLQKKLCVDCNHCVTTYPGAIAIPTYMCDLGKSKVDDSITDYAQINRVLPWKCGGRKWVLKKNAQIVENEEQIRHFESEDWIESFMSLARKVVRGESKLGIATCGGLEKALERAQKELQN